MIQKCVGGLYLCFRVILRVNEKSGWKLLRLLLKRQDLPMI